MVEYGTQKAAPHLLNAAWMLMVEKIEHAHVLIEAPNFRNPMKPYHGQYKTTVGPKTVTKSWTWLVVKVY